MVESSPPAFALIVVNYASHLLLRENLVRATGAGEHAVVVVDNFSTDAERTEVVALCDQHSWNLVGQPNLGFGSGVNAGIAKAVEQGCDVFVLLNPDLIAEPRAVAALADAAATEPDTLVGPRILLPDGRVWFAGGVVNLEDGATRTIAGTDSTQPTGWLTGACLALHLDLWTRIGGFDNDYFLYWEDVDLSWRCTEAGGRLRVLQDVTVVHSVGGTQQAVGKSPLYYYYNCRNRLLFARKHLDASTRRRWKRRSLKAARLIVLRGGKRQFLTRPWQPILAAISGTASGLWCPVPRGPTGNRRLAVLNGEDGRRRERSSS